MDKAEDWGVRIKFISVVEIKTVIVSSSYFELEQNYRIRIAACALTALRWLHWLHCTALDWLHCNDCMSTDCTALTTLQWLHSIALTALTVLQRIAKHCTSWHCIALHWLLYFYVIYWSIVYGQEVPASSYNDRSNCCVKCWHAWLCVWAS